MSFNPSGKSNITVMGYHGGEVIAYQQGSDKNGTYYIDDSGWLHIFSSQFSPFAVTYSTDETDTAAESVSAMICYIVSLAIAITLLTASYDYCRGRKQ